jgi:hypothetical protein
VFERLLLAYRVQFEYSLFAHDDSREIIYDEATISKDQSCLAVQENLRWGETDHTVQRVELQLVLERASDVQQSAIWRGCGLRYFLPQNTPHPVAR